MGKSPRQSFAARRRQNKIESVFFGDMCLGKNPSQPASVRAERVRRSGLHPIEKMLAFLRSVSRFLDTLKSICFISKCSFDYDSIIKTREIPVQ